MNQKSKIPTEEISQISRFSEDFHDFKDCTTFQNCQHLKKNIEVLTIFFS